jgi:hypothetical protein
MGTRIYTVLVTVEVSADDQHEAYGFITHALAHAKKADIVSLDAEVTDERPDEDADPVVAPKLTRQERLQALADAGCDTWEEYRGER